MADYRHATTGSNMKHLRITRSARPYGASPRIGWKATIAALWLALSQAGLLSGQVTITCPPAVNISCSVDPTPANTGSASGSSTCPFSPNVTITYTDDDSNLNGCMGTGILKRTWTATDLCGATASCIQNITIEDNTSPALTCPPFMIVSCDSDTSPATLGMAIATDNCTPQNEIIITYTDNTQNLNQCNGTGTLTRNWTAEDMCGNVAACIQTIVIVDNQAPVLTLPAPVTISCNGSSDPSNTGTATATDNCTSQPTVTFSDNVQGLSGCNGTGTIVRTWTAIDSCNNIASGTQFITVIDNTAPVITCPADVTISCETSTLPANTGSATASDLCGPAFVGYSDELVQPLGCNGTGLIKRTWSSLDGCSNLSSCVQFITIIDQIKPTITCPANITLDCSAGIQPSVAGTPNVSDNCTPTNNLTVTHSDVEIVPLGCNGTGTIQRTWTVTDACGNSSSCNQTIVITDLLKPTIICPPPVTISCESSIDPAVTGTAIAADNCTPSPSIAITYTDNTSGLFGCNGTGLLKRTWRATDLCGNMSSCVQSIWIIDDTDPVITCPPNVEISCSDSSDPSATGSATATDNCSQQVEITYNDNLQLNDCNQTGLILRVWSARDDCGNVKTCTQLITIVDNTPPVVICPPDTIIDCGFYNNPDALGYPTGTDNCTPSGELILDFDDDLSGLTGCTNTGFILRTWYMQDACGNVGSCVQVITVADTTAPTIHCPADVVITCEDSTSPSANGRATATDYCTASLFIDITYEDDMSQAGQCNGSGIIYRTWKATDDCGNVATCVQTIEIVDDEAPQIQCPASYQISCEDDRSPNAQGWANATDNCTPDQLIAISYSDDVSQLTGCNQTGNLYRTWTAIDECGNTATCVQVMTIIDTKKPTAVPPPHITISCESSLDPSVTGHVTASDNCTPVFGLHISVTDDMTGINGCNFTGTIKRTWVVTDDCGNTASCTQNIRIIDTTLPSISCAASIEVNCGDSVDPSVLGIPVISDNCTPVQEMDLLHFDNTTGLNGCNGTGTLYRTWMAFDDCGNSSSCVQAIHVVDKTGPELTLPADLTISCEFRDDLDELGIATATDACTPVHEIEVSYKDNDLGLALCNSTGLRQRTWSATDLCGNITTGVQLIQFIDTLPPIFYTPFDVVINCNENPLDMNLTGEVEVYTDNCAEVADVIVSWEDDFSAIEDCDTDPVIHRIWSLTDPCGNVGTSVQRIKIQDYSMQQIQFPADVNIPCDADMMDLSLTGSIYMPNNACGYLIDTMYSEELGEVQPYQYARRWVCIDYCGHMEQDTQMIYLIDAVKPDIEVHDISISFAYGSEVSIDINQVVSEVEDNCDADVSLALSQDVLTCEDFLTNDEFLLEITATDDQGNVTLEQVIVTLEGGLFTMECPQDIYVYLLPGECTAEVSYSIAPVGLCNQAPVVSQIDGSGLTSGDQFPVGKTPQTYMISDQLGYTMECAFNVNVVEFPQTLALACQDTLHVSVVFECEAVVTADMLLEGDHYGCYDDYVITFTDPSVVYQNGVLDGGPHIGQYLEACISDPQTGNFCCSQLLIEDKLPPVITCSDITIDCTEDIAPHAIPHFPVPSNINVIHLGGNRYQAEGIDNCGPTLLTYTDTEETFMCEGDFSRIITRTWVAVDESGHADTCTEQLFLLRGTIEDFELPADTTIFCGNICLRPDGTPDPECIGGIEGPFCGTFFVGYIDKVVPYCGGSYAVKREWSLVDWCTNVVIDHVQIINVEDNVPPVVDCQDTIQLPAEFGKCGAKAIVHPPTVFDACGSEPITFELIFNNQIILPENGVYILPTLGLGTYDITWNVRDDCGNLSVCETTIILYDNTPPVAYCDQHTVIAINNQDPMGVALLPATTLDDGSFDNCGPVTFRARRMTSCIEFDWTTNGMSHQPDGIINNFDRGLAFHEYVPVSCCDAGEDYILVQLEVKDQQGNVNYCMVQVKVQDKLAPIITCPPDITVSCSFWFDPDVLEHPTDRTFGTVVDGFLYDESERKPIYINDPGNPEFSQPHYWGIDGYVTDNCNLDMDIRVTILDDCSGDDLPGGAPEGAVRLIQRRFTATDPAGRVSFCTQRIWVVNFDPFYINPNNPQDPNDDVIWPEDIEIQHCGIPDTIYPVILNDACAQIGINLKEQRFEFTDGACLKILREWSVIDWCQYNSQTGEGLWKYTQVVKITDDAGALFADCTDDIRVLCDGDPEVTPVVDPAFNTSCFVHLNLTKRIEDVCSANVTYDVKIYPPNSSTHIQAVGPTIVVMNPDGTFDLRLNTATSSNLTLRNYGLEYNDPNIPGEHYKIVWFVKDACGNITSCVDKIRLEDCKLPTPVCIHGLSTVPMPSTGNVTIWAKDFNASSFDNCTSASQLRYSFSGTVYQPSRLFTCDDIIALGVEMPINIWVWDNWNNKDYCTTTIVFTDPTGVCGLPMGGVNGLVTTHELNSTVTNVGVNLSKEGVIYDSFTTAADGSFVFPVVPAGHMYTLDAARSDNPRNGVTTLDLLVLQKHLLGSELLSTPYQLIAADANNNEKVTAIDLVEIRKLILGIYNEFPENRSWRFIPAGYAFPDPYNPWPFEEEATFMVDSQGVIEDFIGVKIGDLNQSVSANIQGIQTRSVQSIPLYVEDKFVMQGEVVEVAMEIPQNTGAVSGGQWELTFEGLQLMEISSAAEGLKQEMIHVSESSVRCAWTPEQPVITGNLMTLRFVALSPGYVRDMIELKTDFINAEIYNEALDAYDLELNWRDEKGSVVSEEVQLHQNTPNPWTDQTVIPFELPEAGEVSLSITNAIGEEVTSIVRRFHSGKHQLKINNGDWPAGMYYYTLRTGDVQLTKTMLILNKR